MVNKGRAEGCGMDVLVISLGTPLIDIALLGMALQSTHLLQTPGDP